MLQIGNSGTTGSLNSDIVINGLLIFDRSDALVHNRAINGSGSIILGNAGLHVPHASQIFPGK